MFCFCPGALKALGYCKVKGVSLHPDGSLDQPQIQAPTLGLLREAAGQEEVGGQRGTGSEGGSGDHSLFVQWWLNVNLGEHNDLL